MSAVNSTPRWSPVRVAGAILLVTTAAALLGLLVAWWQAPSSHHVLAPTSIESSHGFAHFVAVRKARPSPLIDSRHAEAQLIGPMQLLEDGQPIGRIVSGFDSVSTKGGGRFAYMHPVVVFSSSDGSDPRTNGRTYVLRRPIDVRPMVWLIVCVATLLGAGLAFPQRTRQALMALLHFGARDSCTSQRAAGSPAIAICVTVITMLVIVLSQLFLMWWHGTSAHLGMHGYLPVSDALGYYGCAVSLAFIDSLSEVNDWCARRILYPAMLSSLLGLAGWRPSVVLLLQAMIVAMALSALLIALQRSFGWITAVLTTLLLLIFVREFTVGNFMTEALGLPCGLLGLALLLSGIQGHMLHKWWVALGLALISLGMAIRPGALFALPLLGMWLFIATRPRSWKARGKLLLLAAAAIIVGPALHYAMLLALGLDPSNTGGNFATSLYGLSTGSRDWSQAYRDFPEVFRTQPETVAFQTVQEAALARIDANPGVVFGSLAAAGADFSQALFRFGVLTPYNALATGLFLLGALLCVINFRRPSCLLLLALCASESISAPFVYDSGQQRVFAVTVAARLAVLSYAIAWIFSLLTRGAPLSSPVTPPEIGKVRQHESSYSVSVWLGLALVVLAILPATPAARRWDLALLPDSNACGAGQREVVIQPGRESMRLLIGDRFLPIGAEQLGSRTGSTELDPVANRFWWSEGLPRLHTGFVLIYAVQRSPDHAGAIVPAFSRQPLLLPQSRPVALCLAPHSSDAVRLGDYPLHEVVGVH